jgi:L-lysine 2,3-aminomutase
MNAKLVISEDYAHIHRDSKYFPIKGGEHKSKKTIVIILNDGNCTVSCRFPDCESDDQKLKRKEIADKLQQSFRFRLIYSRYCK